jgi:hypothetical protein
MDVTLTVVWIRQRLRSPLPQMLSTPGLPAVKLAAGINTDANLDSIVDGSYLAQADGDMLVIMRKDGTSFAASYLVDGVVAQVQLAPSDISGDTTQQSSLLQTRLRTVGAFAGVLVNFDTARNSYRVVFIRVAGAALQVVSGTVITNAEATADNLQQWIPAGKLVSGNIIRIAGVSRNGVPGVSRAFSLLGSPVTDGDVWNITLNDGVARAFSVTTTGAQTGALDPKAALAARIAAEINKDSNNDSFVDGSYLAIADGVRINFVRRQDGRSFTFNASVTQGSLIFNQLDLRANPIRAGDIWTVTLNAGGTLRTFAVTVDASDAAASNPKVEFAAKLAAAITAGGIYDATADGATLGIRHLAGTAFTSGYSVNRPFALTYSVPAPSQVSVTGTASANYHQKLVFSISVPAGTTVWGLRVNNPIRTERRTPPTPLGLTATRPASPTSMSKSSTTT